MKLAIIFTTLLQLAAFTCVHSQDALIYSTTPYNFTLAAHNVSLPNVNSTGAPLVLGAGGATGGVSLYSTATWNSFPYGDLKTFGLVNNALRAFYTDGSWRINATTVRDGEQLTWLASTLYPAPGEKNAVYSVIAPSPPPETEGTSVYPTLAAHNRTDLWSLCPDKYSHPQTRLIFNVSAISQPPPSWLGFDPENCYGVVVHVLTTALDTSASFY